MSRQRISLQQSLPKIGRSTIGVVIQQPRDYQKVLPLVASLDRSSAENVEWLYIIDDLLYGSRFSNDVQRILSREGETFCYASSFLSQPFILPIAIYASSKHVSGSQFFLPWVVRNSLHGRLSRGALKQAVLGQLSVALGPLKQIFGLQCIKSDSTFGSATEPGLDARSSLGRDQAGMERSLILRASTTIKRIRSRTLSRDESLQARLLYWMWRVLTLPTPLAADLSARSILAPPSYDDVSDSFPGPETATALDVVLCASRHQARLAETNSNCEVAVIGYPQYWDIQDLPDPGDALRESFDLTDTHPILAWLPTDSDVLLPGIQFLRPLATCCNVIVRPHPDLYLDSHASLRHRVLECAREAGVLVDDTEKSTAGRLIRGSDLIVAQGVSSLLSTVYLNRPALVGLEGRRGLLRTATRLSPDIRQQLQRLPSIDLHSYSVDRLNAYLPNGEARKEVQAQVHTIRGEVFGNALSGKEARSRLVGVAAPLLKSR